MAPARLAALKKWDRPVLNVRFIGGRGGVALHLKVLAYANEWRPFSGIEFRRSDAQNAEIIVGFQENARAADGGHWSYVGVDAIREPAARQKSMNLAINIASLDNDPYHQAVVRHEFGHALGCIHEHQSPGAGGIEFHTENTIRYFAREYGWSRQLTIDNVLTPYRASQLQRFSDFDPQSIMLYRYPGEITRDGVGTQQNHELSRVDKEYIALLYEQPVDGPDGVEQPPPSRVLPTDGTPVTGRIMPSARVNKFTFELSETASCKIWTEGYTQVDFKLFSAEGTSFELTTDTPDLVNRRATRQLGPGKYYLEVRHKHSGGTGEYRIRLKTKT